MAGYNHQTKKQFGECAVGLSKSSTGNSHNTAFGNFYDLKKDILFKDPVLLGRIILNTLGDFGF